jgi:hypothetical protein
MTYFFCSRRALAFCLMLFVIAGCSNNSSLVTAPGTGALPTLATSWFPLTPGSSSTFETTDADGFNHLVTFKVGNLVSFGSSTAYQWFILENGAVQDTDFVVATATAVYVYESSFSAPEQILKVPVATGSTWNRYAGSTRDTISIITGGEGKDNGDTGDSGDGDLDVFSKIFPTEGSNEMKVVRVDQLTLDNGSHYSGTAEITNSNPGGSTNHYWFAPGLGLVKYVIGATQSRPSGQASGEMIQFSK